MRGQMVLIIVLILTIAATVALALIGRSTMDVGVTTNIEESQRAFHAAESGIEQLLSNSGSALPLITLSSGATVVANKQSIGGTNAVYTVPNGILRGEAGTVFLVSHDDATGELKEDVNDALRFKGPTLGVCIDKGYSEPAVELIVVYKRLDRLSLDANPPTLPNYQVGRFAYDMKPDRITENGFTSFSDIGGTDVGDHCGKSNVYYLPLPIPTDVTILPLMLRIRPYYRDISVYIDPGADFVLPQQGDEITSTGDSGTGILRKIVVKRAYTAADEFMDYSLYTQGAIGH